MFGWIQSHPYAYPALEVVHLFGIAMLLGNLMLLEARVFGAGAALDARALARLSLTIATGGFALAAASGLLMFASQPLELIANAAFRWKMLLLMLAGCNAAWFHARQSLVRLDGIARAIMLASTLIWLAVLTCGRWIAYR